MKPEEPNMAPQILVVDDDRLILYGLTVGLRSAGYRTIDADSGEKAIKIAHEHEIDLAIVDVRMPGMSGIELAEQLRAHAGIPCIFLSAYSDTAIVELAVAQGALGYLIKPLDVPNIIPSIKAALVRSKELSTLKKSAAQLSTAVSQSREISTAIGVLMERTGLDREQAFEALRRAARRQRRKLEDLASALLSGTAEFGNIVEARGKHSSSPRKP